MQNQKSAWIGKKDLFQVEDELPDLFINDDRDDAKLFRDLHGLAKTHRKSSFWIEMAKEERRQKGQLTRLPLLVMPPGEKFVERGSQASQSPVPDDEEEDLKTKGVDDQTPMVPDDVTSGDDIVAIYIGNGAGQDIFHLARECILTCPFLRQNLRENDPPFIMHPRLHHMTPAQFAPVKEFLSDWDYDPKLIVVNEEATPEGSWEELLGDQLDVGLKYKLENITCAEDLNNLIRRLGHVYLTAKAFGLSQMKGKTLQKLQVAWNIYSGVPQLIPFLETIRFVMEQTQDDEDSIAKGTNCEAMQTWAVTHLTDLIMVYVQTHPEEIAHFMRDFPAIQAAVFSMRASNVAADEGKYSRLEDRFMTREIVFVGKEPEGVNLESD